MGCRWVAAALMVVGIISSMNHQVEGSLKEQIKEIRDKYVKIVEGGRGDGETCAVTEETGRRLAKLMAALAGRSYDELEEDMKEKHGSDVEARMTEVITFLNLADSTYGQLCTLKKQLVCAGGKCTACSKTSDFKEYCGYAKTIAEAGGWSVRPVNGALVAALLALFALSF